MKQLSKEELIEYFIEQLGDNEILGKVMSIEQIREKLNYVIKDVSYNDLPENIEGQWEFYKDGKGTVKFDLKKISSLKESHVIVHELLHALSTSIIAKYTFNNQEQIKEKCGVLKTSKIYKNDGSTWGNRGVAWAINEGMTDTLAEMITGVNYSGYITEKDVYKILTVIIGQDTMLKKYFSDDVEQRILGEDPIKEELIKKYGEEKGKMEYAYLRGGLLFSEDLMENTFEKDFENKYGKTLGEKLFTDFKKVSGLLDQLLDLDRKDAIYGLNQNGRTVHSKARKELYTTLENMIENIMEHEPNIKKKIENIFIPLCDTSLEKKYYDKLLEQLAYSEELEFEQKTKFLKKINKSSRLPYNEKIQKEEELIINLLSNNIMTGEERINYFWSLCDGMSRNASEKMYEWYVESGVIMDSEVPKKSIFVQINSAAKNRSELEKYISNTKYKKMGEHYCFNDPEFGYLFINNEGKIKYPYKLKFLPSHDEVIDLYGEDGYYIPKHLHQKEIITNLSEQIRENRQMNTENGMNTLSTSIFDNILMTTLIDENKKIQRRFYKIQNNGTLEEIEPRS